MMGNNRWTEVNGFKTESGGRTGRFPNGLAVTGDGERAEGLAPALQGWVRGSGQRRAGTATGGRDKSGGHERAICASRSPPCSRARLPRHSVDKYLQHLVRARRLNRH